MLQARLFLTRAPLKSGASELVSDRRSARCPVLPPSQTLGRLFGRSAKEECAACTPESLGCKPPEPGSVTPHDIHILIKLPLPAGADRAQTDEYWWEEKVDGEAPLAAINASLKERKEALGGKKVKGASSYPITAFDYATAAPLESAAGTTDLLVFPGSKLYRGLPLTQLPAAVGASILPAGDADSAAALPAPELLPGLTLLVCCHIKRDGRCAALGPPLVDMLVALAAARGLTPEAFHVFRSSHVGGHVHAGNVIVYSGGGDCAVLDGDWFGGLHAGNAEEFLDALLNTKAVHGGAGDAALRSWWRGRIGLSKDGQLQYFGRALADIEDLGGKA